MIEPLSTWKTELQNLPKVGDTSWAANFAGWYADMIVNIQPDTSTFSAAGFSFTFNTATFAAGLIGLQPTPDATAGITGFANAWEQAILSSVLVVGTGSALLPSTPATTFSVVAASIINPPSIALGKAKIISLATLGIPSESKFPEYFRDATLMLNFSVTGTNSVTPPAGPNPLIVPLVALT